MHCRLFDIVYPKQLCLKFFPSNSLNHEQICPRNKLHQLSCARNHSNFATLTYNYFESTNQTFMPKTNTSAHEYCVYKPNDCHIIQRSAYGEQLLSCEHYTCPTKYFKCPGFYCVPWRLVCNGQWECPGGIEEMQCNRTACPAMFKCKNSSICITVDSLCDNISDCNLNDDEHFCSIVQIANDCPSNCSCLLFSLKCENATLDINSSAPW